MGNEKEIVRATQYMKHGKASELSEINMEMIIASGVGIAVMLELLSTHPRWK